MSAPWRTTEGSTGRLLQLCSGYYVFYVIFGIATKWFTKVPDGPRLNDVEFLAYSTLGGNLICMAVVLACRWYRLKSTRLVRWGPLRFPHELLYIVPSGVCTAVVIPTTTLLYMLLPSVMVAMVTMRASVIIVSRIVDGVQIRQGILEKTVYREEEVAIVFALIAVSVQLFFGKGDGKGLVFPPAALAVLGSYIVAYLFRIYIMNYYKNTRGKGVRLDNEGFFAIEQISATVVLAVASVLVFFAPALLGEGARVPAVEFFRAAVERPHVAWGWAVFAGTVYGLVAFVSVFIFMFKGRTATFAGLVNRLTSLVAGTTATLASAAVFGLKYPESEDWVSLGFILVAVFFLALAERRRAAELAASVAAAAASPGEKAAS